METNPAAKNETAATDAWIAAIGTDNEAAAFAAMKAAEAARTQADAAAAAAAKLDALTRHHTGFATFEAMLEPGTTYRPSIYPQRYSTAAEAAELKQLADAYDAAQAKRGDARRAYRGMPEWWSTPTAVLGLLRR